MNTEQIAAIKDLAQKMIFPNTESLSDEQDAMLDSSLEVVRQRLMRRIPKGIPYPSELNYLIVEATIVRFNLIGSEGYTAESVEGHSISLRDPMDYIRWYQEIDDWLDDNGYGESRQGRVVFL